MDNGRITGGSVAFTKRVNKGSYEHEEASAKIDFVAHDDMDAGPVLAAAETEAKTSVLAQLGLTPRPLVLATTQVAPIAATAGAAKPTGRVAHRKSKEIEAADAADPAPVSVTGSPNSAPEGAGDDPLAAVGASAPTTQTASPAASGASVGASDDPLAPAGGSDMIASSPLTDDPFTAQREISDTDLGAAAAKKNEHLVGLYKEAGTAKIRDLIGQYLAPGKVLREIPQADRPGFLAKLAALA